MKQKNSQENQKLINPRQLSILLILCIFGGCAIFIYTPNDPQHCWITYLAAGTGGILLLSIYLWLYKRSGELSLMDILIKCLGKFAGTFVSLLYAAFFLANASLTLSTYSGYLKLNSYFDTPRVFITLMLGGIAVYALYKGLRVVARASESFVWATLGISIIADIILIKYVNLENIYPLTNIEIVPMLQDTFYPLTLVYGVIVVLFFLFPDTGSCQEIKKPLFTGMGILIAVLTILVLRTLLVLGGNMINRYTYPLFFGYSISYPLKFGVFVSTTLGLSALIRMLVFVYAAIAIFKNTFHTKFSPFIVPAVLAVSITGGYLFENVVELLDFLKGIWAYCSAAFEIVIPLILLPICLLKKNSKRGRAA